MCLTYIILHCLFGFERLQTGYISEHSEAEFSHGIRPGYAEKLYPEYYKKGKQE